LCGNWKRSVQSGAERSTDATPVFSSVHSASRPVPLTAESNRRRRVNCLDPLDGAHWPHARTAGGRAIAELPVPGGAGNDQPRMSFHCSCGCGGGGGGD